jgi:hypothetical protein
LAEEINEKGFRAMIYGYRMIPLKVEAVRWRSDLNSTYVTR